MSFENALSPFGGGWGRIIECSSINNIELLEYNVNTKTR